MELRLLSNNLTIFPDVSVVAGTLRSLYLSRNHIETIPPERVSTLVNLKELILISNRLTTFPFDELVPLSNLLELNLGKNKIASLPDVQGLNLITSVSLHFFHMLQSM